MSIPDRTSNSPVDRPLAKSYALQSQRNSGFSPPSQPSSMQSESGSEMLVTFHSPPADDVKWALVVDELCKLSSPCTAVLISFNSRLGRQELTVRGGSDFMEEGQPLSNDDYYAVDPFGEAPFGEPNMRQPLTEITLGGELVSHEQFHKTKLHNDIAARRDLHHLAVLPLVSTPKHFDALSAWRGGTAGEFDAETLHLFECALPHLRAAQDIRCELANAKLRAARAEAALEHTFAAAFLLDAAGRVVHMNRPGEAMISFPDGVMLRRNRIIATNASQQSQLKALIACALSTAQASAMQTGGAIALERSSGRRPLFVRVLPLRVELTAGHTPSGHALLLITDPDAAVKDPAILLKSLFSLTTAEIAVATNLRAGFTLVEIAAVRRVSLETIRSQVKSLLQKTNTRRQSDLILLLTTLIT
jgi:DNA-binding CsgD family transcriptional regulator